MLKKVFLNTASQIVAKAVTASVTLIVTILIGKTLKEAGYGEFTKIFVYIGYFYTLADFGLNAIYVKEAKDSSQLHFLRVLLGLRLTLAAVLVLAAIMISIFLPYDPQTAIGFPPTVKAAIALLSITIITQSLLTTANAFFQKNLRYEQSTIAVSFGALVVLIGAVIVTVTKRSLFAYTAIYVWGGITNVLIAYFLIKRRLKTLPLPSFSLSAAKSMLKPAWPIGLALILNLIYFRIDVLILSTVRASRDVGIYGLAYQFFEAALAIPIFFANAIYPTLVAHASHVSKEFKSQVKSWVKILTAASLSLTLALFLIAYIIPIIYQGRFAASTPVLQILSLGMPFFFLSALFWHVLIVKGRQRYLVAVYALGAVFNLLTNLIFIPVYGYFAAATTTVASEALVLLLLFWGAKYD